jgi:hypothetical protein
MLEGDFPKCVHEKSTFRQRNIPRSKSQETERTVRQTLNNFLHLNAYQFWIGKQKELEALYIPGKSDNTQWMV